MVEENDNRLASVMREVVKNSDQYIEQMLIYDLLRRNHLETYLRNTLRQIELCLDKNVDKFIHTTEYKQAKGLFQDKEMEYQGWSENYGNQVRVKEDNLKLLEKAAEEKRKNQEKEKEKQQKVMQSEWDQKTSNGHDPPKKKKKKERRGKRGKGKGGRGVVRKWVESNDPKIEKSTISQSAWLVEDSEKKKEKNKHKPEAALPSMVRESLMNYNLSLEGKKEPFKNLPRQKKYILRPLPSDCFISNISFSLYDKELPQGSSKNTPSSSYILENLDRLFTPEKQNLVFEIGEELRPENLLPNAEDLPIDIDDFITPLAIDTNPGGLFTTHFPFKRTIEDFLAIREPDEITIECLNEYLRTIAPQCSEDMIKWLLVKKEDDHVSIVVNFLVILKTENPKILEKALVILCTEDPVHLFNIHVLFKLKKQDIDAPPEIMNKFVKSWFVYCNQNILEDNDVMIKRQQSMKKILAGFIKNTISTGSYDLGLLCREVDEFCSQNSSMNSVRKMKQAIDERQKSQNKRRK
jgi:hypothetical protein